MSFLLVIACFGVAALAQDVSHAVCSNPGFSWTFNSLGQNPCQIGEALGTQCEKSFFIQPLPVGSYYSGLNPTAATSCACNTVYYTLLAACAACQSGNIYPFPIWSENCTTEYSTFPGEIPAGTAVPYYAYLPLVNGTVDGDAAMHAQGPEATGSSQPTSSGAFTAPASTPSSSAPSSKGGSADAGAIAGAVKRRKADASKESEPMMDVGPWTGDTPPLFTGSIIRRLDPNDPSTYPLAGGAFQDEQGGQWNPPAYVASPPPTTYQGAPEF
ncbi:hypothetical protein CPB85DRAFT_1439659 [Mucidula mucida]|nr:hypothetical protein CPB85DRAFT_1439659 [Mucidula mucida]